MRCGWMSYITYYLLIFSSNIFHHISLNICSTVKTTSTILHFLSIFWEVVHLITIGSRRSLTLVFCPYNVYPGKLPILVGMGMPVVEASRETPSGSLGKISINSSAYLSVDFPNFII